MALYSSRLENLVLPIDLARKGKGIRSVFGKFSIATNTYIEPTLFLTYFLSLANTVFTANKLEDIVKEIVKDFKVSTIEIGVSFDIPVDRLSESDFTEATSVYNCGYQCIYSKKKIKNYIWIELPSVVQEIVPQLAKLTLVLGYKEIVPYFEDVLFAIEKVVIPLNPTLTVAEKDALRIKLLSSKSTYVIISELLDYYQNNSYIISCASEVKYRSCVLNTDLCHTAEVRKK